MFFWGGMKSMVVSVCLADGMEGVVFHVLRLLVSDAGGQVMRWSGRFTAESVCYSVSNRTLLWPRSAKTLPTASADADVSVFSLHFHFFIFIYCFLSPSLLKQKMSTGGNSWTSAGREETRSAAAGPLSDCRADQSKWVARARQPIGTRKRGLPAKLAQLEAKEGYTFMTFLSSVCQHTMKGSQRCITATCAVHASLT